MRRIDLPVFICAGFISVLALGVALLAACDQDTGPGGDIDAGAGDGGAVDTSPGADSSASGALSCVGCHTDEEQLKAVVAVLHPPTPDEEAPEDSGDG